MWICSRAPLSQINLIVLAIQVVLNCGLNLTSIPRMVLARFPEVFEFFFYAGRWVFHPLGDI